jgi:ATP-binding cassette subfamily B protein
MHEPQRHANRPFAFILSYVRRRKTSHLIIVSTILAAVACSTATQYGVKTLVDALSGVPQALGVWGAFALLVSLITADNLSWRIAGWISSSSFVGVTGDLRRDLFRHLTGHSLSYFSDRGPGTLSSRITAASNAIFTLENLFIWNLLPPCVATIAAIALVATVSVPMALGLSALAGVMVLVMFRLAAAGQPLHHDFADKAAAIDGEMVDVISNMSLVRAFGGRRREHRRFDDVVDLELSARQRSLRYLEKLRIIHAGFTILLTIGLLAWAIVLWQRGAATTGDVILACTLGLTILHATRDLAVALVDATQHLARLAEALPTLLHPHDMPDHPTAKPLVRGGARLTFERIAFRYADGHDVFSNFNLEVEPGQRVGLVGQSGAGKSTLFALIQRFYPAQGGRVLIDGQDIAHITQDSLRDAIAIARAFLRDAPLLLLDEATSSLDSESEETIRESLSRLMRGRTVIAIAHRLSTVRSFDRIVLLDRGRVMEDGSPDSLLRRDGPYRRLIRTELGRLQQTAA